VTEQFWNAHFLLIFGILCLGLAIFWYFQREKNEDPIQSLRTVALGATGVIAITGWLFVLVFHG
jgi:hypothetical protein